MDGSVFWPAAVLQGVLLKHLSIKCFGDTMALNQKELMQIICICIGQGWLCSVYGKHKGQCVLETSSHPFIICWNMPFT